jgi:hypothetical protein
MARTYPDGSRRLRFPEIQDSRHIKVLRLSVLCTGRLYPIGHIPGSHFCHRQGRPQGQIVTRRIMSRTDTSSGNTCYQPIPVAVRSKEWVCGRSLARIAGSNPSGGWDICIFCVLLGRGLCDGSIFRLGDSYRV